MKVPPSQCSQCESDLSPYLAQIARQCQYCGKIYPTRVEWDEWYYETREALRSLKHVADDASFMRHPEQVISMEDVAEGSTPEFVVSIPEVKGALKIPSVRYIPRDKAGEGWSAPLIFAGADLVKVLINWISDPRVANLVTQDCDQVADCSCLVHETTRVIRKWYDTQDIGRD